jgi:hypothetical protein
MDNKIVDRMFGMKTSNSQTFNTPERQNIGATDDFVVRKVMNTLEGTIEKVPINDNDIVNKAYADSISSGAPEGTAVKSTGESGGTKFLREDGDGTCSWQSVGAGAETDPVFTAWEAGVGDIVTHDTSEFLDSATAGDIYTHDASEFATALGGEDNYVTDVEKAALHASGSDDTITIANEATDTTCFPIFVTASGAGDLGLKSNTTLTFNSNTGLLNATSLGINGTAISSTAAQLDGAVTHAADNTQAHSDYLLNSGVDEGVGLTLTGDNSSADTAYVPMVLYNTDETPPTASNFPIGTIYVQYTA